MIMSLPLSIDRIDLDPLEEVLALTGARVEQAAALSGRGRWAVRFPSPKAAKFNSLIEGECTLEIDGSKGLLLAAGDSFLLTRPVPFVLRGPDSARVEPVHASPLFRGSSARDAVVGPAEEAVTVRLIGGAVQFDRSTGALLLDSLPPVLHVPRSAPSATSVQATLLRIDTEIRRKDIGWSAASDHLGLVLLIDMLRSHIDAGGGSGWIAGLADPVVAVMLKSMHSRPDHSWTVQELADRAHVSRATAAARFKKSVGTGPVEYLRAWRIEVASAQLASTNAPISQVARSVGYGSETAFGLAFRNLAGMTPAGYRRAQRAQQRARQRT